MRELSHNFRRNYKRFLIGEISLLELKKSVEIPKDVFFFQDECNRQKKVSIDGMISNVVDVFIDDILSQVEKAPDAQSKKSDILKSLTVFLGNYSCFVEESIKMKCADVMSYFMPFVPSIVENKHLDCAAREMMSLISSDNVRDMKAVIKIIVFKLISFYATLSVSDQEGGMKCISLAKEISHNFYAGYPVAVTLLALQKRVRNSRSLVNEIDLLERFSF